MDIYGTNSNGALTGTGLRNDITARDGKNHLPGNGGPDDLCGGGADETLNGGKGSDGMRGGKGDDPFLASADNDTTKGLSACDRIQLTGFDSFAEVLAVARVVDRGDSTLIDLGGGSTLLLEDVRVAHLAATMFGFPGGPSRRRMTRPPVPGHPPQ